MTSAAPSLTLSVPSQDLADALEPLPEGVDVVVWNLEGAAPRPSLDIVVPPYMGGRESLRALADVPTRLVQWQSIGYEGVTETLPAGRLLANAASVHEPATAELAVALALASQRRIPQFVRRQDAGTWMPEFSPSLADRRVLVLGYGGVGKAVAARLAPFETELTAVATRARDEDGVHVHGIDELAELLPAAEILIVTLPGGDATRGLIGAAELALLPDDALVVNVGRGPVIDTDALVAEVAAGRLRAALDVTEPEPLPAGHPLWSLPGALIVPHVGGDTTAMRPRIVRVIRTQVERMLAGEPPINLVVGG